MDEKKPGVFKKVLLIIISIIVIGIVCLFGLNFIGVPVGKTLQAWGNNIPVINYFIPDPATKNTEESSYSDNWKQKYLNSNEIVKEKDQKISDLKEQISFNQTDIEDLKKSNAELQKQFKDNQSKKSLDEMKKIAGIYSNMQESKAASILESMSIEDAAITFSALGQDQQSNILASMKDIKKAAQITMLLKEMSSIVETDPAAYKEQVRELAHSQDNPTETLAATIAGMPPAQSASIIQSMMATNQQVALGLLKNVNTSSRSQILTEITKLDAKLAATITASLNK